MRVVGNRVFALAAIAAIPFGATAARAASPTTLGPAVWVNPTNSPAQAWQVPASWDTATAYPNGVGAVATFNNPTANRAVTFTPPAGEAAVTFGSLTLNNTTAFTNTFTSGSTTVTLDAVGAGPVAINFLGAASSSAVPTTFGPILSLVDSVTFTVDKTTSSSTVADASLTAIMSGAGGMTKAGLGTLVITDGSGVTKTYTGATAVQAGRLRVGTLTGSPGVPLANTSGVSVSTDAQLDLGPNATTLRFGTSSATPITINGIGILPGTPVGGTFGTSGAIRANATGTTILSNDIVIGSDQASITTAGTTAAGPANVLVLNGVISGASGNRLRINPSGDATTQLKAVVQVTNTNTYSGGTLISQGVLRVTGANATLGTGDVFVDGASNVLIPGFLASTAGLAAGQLTIDSGVLNAIADTATLTLTGDTATFGGPDAAVGGIANLGAGINETVGGLVLGGVAQTIPGTYGSTASAATFQNDAYFTGPGVVTLAVPEPTSLAFLGLGGLALIRRRRGA